jgi:hypothetical protein
MTTSPEICHPECPGRLMVYIFLARLPLECQNNRKRAGHFQQVFPSDMTSS